MVAVLGAVVGSLLGSVIAFGLLWLVERYTGVLTWCATGEWP